MKKLIPWLFALVCALGLAGCVQGGPDGKEASSPFSETGSMDKAQADVRPEDQVFDSRLSYAGYADWTQAKELYTGALNGDKQALSSVRQLPIYKFDTLEDLERFRLAFGEVLSMENGWDEIPSFNDAAAEYDKAYFKENTLLLVYISANNSTHRYRADDIFCDGTSLRVYIEETTGAEAVDTAMAGWFLTVEVPDTIAAGCTEFDARLQ